MNISTSDDHAVLFTEQIEAIAALNGHDYLDAVISFCDKNNLDYEAVGEIISNIPKISLKLQEQAEGLHFLKPESRLPY